MADEISSEVMSNLQNLLDNAPKVADTNETGEALSETNDEVIDTDESTEVETDDNETSEDPVDDGETPEEESDDEEGSDDDNLLTEEYYDDTFVEIDGERVNLGELRKGYLRHSDYTKKTTEAAQMRKEAEKIASEAQIKADTLVQQRFELVALDVEKRIGQFNQIDWTALARSNPNDYTQLKAEYDSLLGEANKLQSEYFAMQKQKQDKINEAKTEEAKETFQKLRADIPNFNKDLYLGMLDYAVNSGLSKDVVENLTDYASLSLIYKAFKYDNKNNELKTKVTKSEKPSVKSKLKQKARVEVSEKELNQKATDKIRAKLNDANNKGDRNALETDLVMKALFKNQ